MRNYTLPERAILSTKKDQSHKKDSRVSRYNPTGCTKWGTIYRKWTIKSLRKGKCPGPDNIANEIFLKTTGNTRKMYLKMLNHILEKGSIPEQWLNGNITRLYKGKGTKGKCLNERGISLARNAGKLFERMGNNRATTTAQMTAAQAGETKPSHCRPPRCLQRSSQLEYQNTRIQKRLFAPPF